MSKIDEDIWNSGFQAGIFEGNLHTLVKYTGNLESRVETPLMMVCSVQYNSRVR